ncbi:hypothetical protein IPL85_01520 [Candidatus Saccharibacteria bacterium]|nr:MAG: hypothetical protein IPL85_01520 [Candidatus Saccharibacteria bacterium]
MHRHHFITRFLLISLIFGSMYSLLHVMNRSLANDMPQLLATQAAKQLDAGLGLQSINMGATDLANNPVPFVIVYDKKEKAVAGSGYLGRILAQMPRGVVEHAKPGKPHAVTWAPREDIRIASITVASKDYYVVGGQSLKATDNRARLLLWCTLAAYAAALLIMLAVRLCRCRLCRLARSTSDVQGCQGNGSCMCSCADKVQADTTPHPAATKEKLETKKRPSRVKSPADK